MSKQASITLRDVARKAGVSPITVSRVINGTSYVSAKTRQSVQAAIEELGFVPNSIARSLVVRQTGTVAYVAAGIDNPFDSLIFRGIEDVMDQAGINVFVGSSMAQPAKETRLIEAFVSRQVDGLILCPMFSTESNFKAIARRRIPFVTAVYDVHGYGNDRVVGDNIGGARALTNHLLNLGHRRIAMIGGPLETTTGRDRLAGFRLALEEAGVRPEPELERSGPYSSESGHALTHELIQTTARPTAIFAGNNYICLGALLALRELGLRVPEDMALVSFDDFEVASQMWPFLTVAVEPAYEMGRLAAQMLLERIRGVVKGAGRRVVLPVEVIARQSCGQHLRTPTLTESTL